MVVSIDLMVNDLIQQGKKYAWVKPLCPACGARVWWHGFVFAFFSIYPCGIYIRRVRCPHCKGVHRLKPKGYWPRFRFSKKEIRDAIECREKNKTYIKNSAEKSTMQRWWINLKRMIKMVLTLKFEESCIIGFDLLVKAGIIPVSSVK